jgi:hypothetical protein
MPVSILSAAIESTCTAVESTLVFSLQHFSHVLLHEDKRIAKATQIVVIVFILIDLFFDFVKNCLYSIYSQTVK